MSCGLSTVNLRFRELQLSDYQPIVRFPSESFLMHSAKFLNRRRSCIVVSAVNRVILESLVDEFRRNTSLLIIDFSNTHINKEIDNKEEFAKHIAKGITASASLTRIDLSLNGLGNEGKHIAEGIAVSASLTDVDLSYNALCGVNFLGQGIFNANGIKEIAQAISVSAALTRINLTGNSIGPMGAKHIAQGISACKSLTSINLYNNMLGDEGAKHVSDGIAVSASLTQVLVLLIQIK